MHLLRAVRNQNSFAPATFDLEAAISGLTDSNDPAAPISVYRVDDEATAYRVLTLYAMHAKRQPEKICCVLIPDDLIPRFGLTVLPTPSDIQHPLLHQTHHDLSGLQSREDRARLAEAIRDHNATGRIRLEPEKPALAQDLKRLGKVELADAQWGAAARALIEDKPRWLALLD